MLQKKNRRTLLLSVAAGALLAGAGTATIWVFSQRGAGQADLPTGADAIPQDVLLAISLSTDTGQWQQLRAFGTPQSQTAFNQSLAQLRDRVLTANGVDYDRDIKPWIGKEVTIAFLPPAAATVPSAPNALPPIGQQQQAAIAVLPIQDPLKAQQTLGNLKPRSGNLSKRTYQGIEIQETKGTSSQNLSVAALDAKLLLVTTDAKLMNRAIDSYKGGAGLSTLPGYTQALGKLPAVNQPFGKIFVNLPLAANANAANTGKPASPQTQQLQGLASIANIESEGVRLRSVYWLKPDSQRRYEVRNSAKIMPDRLPADTLIMASGGNLKRFWQDYSQGSTVNPIPSFDPRVLREGLKSTVNMDLDKDFLNWMDGEFSLALVSAPEGSSPTLPFSLLFMVQASDRRAAESALKQLDQAMATKYQFKVEETKVGNQPVVNWSLPYGGAAISHGWMDNNVAFLSLGAPIANSLLPKPAQTLADSDVFKKTTPLELRSNNGHFFVNVDQAVNVKKLPLLQLPPGNRELFAAIQSLGVTAAYSDDRSIRFDVFAALQKGNQPAPLPAPTIPPTTPSTPIAPLPSPSPR